MYATDFEYDGLKLSDFGMMICSFDSSGGLETVSSGSDISFNTVKSTGSNRFKYYGAKYDEAYTSTFKVCKNVCQLAESNYLESSLVSGIQRWLCRKDNFHPFKPIQDDLKDIFWNATFSCKQILINGKIAGLELTMYTDAPYAYLNIDTISYSPTSGESFSIYDMSDEIGSIYPKVSIYCKGNGKIQLQNSLDKKLLVLTNVVKGETITLDGENKMIQTDNSRDNLASNFNYYFPRIINTFECRDNVFTLSSDSVACDITFSYAPIIKVGL